MLMTLAALVWSAPVASAFGIQTETDGSADPVPNPPAETASFDPSDWLTGVRQRADELAGRAAAASEPIDRIKLWQAAANVALAYELVPICAQRLLGPSTGISADQASAARESLQRSDEWLEQAQRALEAATADADQNHTPEKELAQMMAQARLTQSALQSFSSALSALWLPKSESGEQDVRKAASELTILLESDDPPVVTAASLWYAALRSRESELAPSLSVLGFALSRPPVSAERIDLLSKLFYCRLIARRDGFAAALTLLAQLEELSRDWFAEPEARQSALAAITAVQIDVLRDWESALGQGNSSSEREWCQKRRARLHEERTIDPVSLLEFLQVIPILRDEARRP